MFTTNIGVKLHWAKALVKRSEPMHLLSTSKPESAPVSQFVYWALLKSKPGSCPRYIISNTQLAGGYSGFPTF